MCGGVGVSDFAGGAVRSNAAQRERLGSRLTLYMDGSGDEVLGGGADTMGPASKEIGRGAILV
jgi:hypothetical protein